VDPLHPLVLLASKFRRYDLHMERRQAIGDVLRGLEIDGLPDKWTAVDVVCMVKCLDQEGKPLWALRMSDGLNEEELLGTLVIQTALLKRDMIEDWKDE
jgi:hypothetical protein